MRVARSILGLIVSATLGFAATNATAQGKGVDRLYVMDCGHNAATDGGAISTVGRLV